MDTLGSPLDLAAARLRLEVLARRQREFLVLAAALGIGAAAAGATGIGLDWPLLAGALAAALCVRMLREPVTSPLYNSRLPEEQLDRLLTTIERGVEL